MPDLESIQSLEIGFCNLDALNLRIRRTFANEIDELVDCLLFALEMRLDGTVAAIANPSANAERPCLVGGPCAEEDPLDVPCDSQSSSAVSH